MDDLGDTLASEGLLTETPLDVIQDLRMGRILIIEDVFELKIRGP